MADAVSMKISSIREAGLERSVLSEMFRRMLRIRQYEDAVNFLFLQGKLAGTIHQCQGQEAVAVGSCIGLNDDDYITTTHRPAGHCIAKGMTVHSMMAEMFGKVEGCCQGKGGSMHLGDMDKGVIPAIAIVGAGVPISSGVALGFKMQGNKRLAMAFFGDGAVNEGAFHEGINLAVVWKAPAIFICENNFYGASTHISKVIGTNTIAERTQAYGLPVDTLDGNDVIAVYNAVKRAVERARNGGGPTFIECQTYRRTGHSRSDPNKYRVQEEEAYWLSRDPIVLFRKALMEESLLSESEVDQIENEVKQEVEAAIEYARACEDPKPEDALTGVFSDAGEGN